MQLYFFCENIHVFSVFFFLNDLSLQKYVVLIFDRITRLVFSEIMNFWRKKTQWIKHGVNVEGFPQCVISDFVITCDAQIDLLFQALL